MNLILLEPGEVDAAGHARLTGHRAAHTITVLRATPGKQVRVGLIDGAFGTATVVSTGEGTVDLHCEFETTTPSRQRVDLLLALPRPKVLRRLWAQVAALGVGRIILTNAERVERNYFDTHVITPECYRPLLIEGLQQARDTRVPVVSVHRQFKILIEDELDGLVGDAERLVADPSVRLSEWRRGPSGPRGSGGPEGPPLRTDRVLLAIGPEGGWNTFELDLLRAHGFQSVSLGPRTLRTDTACIALLAAYGSYR